MSKKPLSKKAPSKTDRIAGLVSALPGISAGEVSRKMGIPSKDAASCLKQLFDRNRVTRKHSDDGSYIYYPIDHFSLKKDEGPVAPSLSDKDLEKLLAAASKVALLQKELDRAKEEFKQVANGVYQLDGPI